MHSEVVVSRLPQPHHQTKCKALSCKSDDSLRSGHCGVASVLAFVLCASSPSDTFESMVVLFVASCLGMRGAPRQLPLFLSRSRSSVQVDIELGNASASRGPPRFSFAAARLPEAVCLPWLGGHHRGRHNINSCPRGTQGERAEVEGARGSAGRCGRLGAGLGSEGMGWVERVGTQGLVPPPLYVV